MPLVTIALVRVAVARGMVAIALGLAVELRRRASAGERRGRIVSEPDLAGLVGGLV